MNTLRVLRDLVVLEWDGVLPPGTPEAAVHCKADVLPFWTHLKDFARYSRIHDNFVLDLSSQNLMRIYRQFGKIPVREGQDRIDGLKKRQAYFRGMVEMAQRIKAEALPSAPIAYKMPPLAPYQDIGVQLLSMVPRLPLFADCGCLSGDTLVRVSRRGASRTRTLAQLYHSQEHPRRHRNKAAVTKVRAFKGSVIGLHPITRVVESGVKDVLALVLEDGKVVKATPDHEILTQRGWVPLQALGGEDSAVVDNHGVPEYSKVVSVTPVGREMTYDIVCEDPHRNFVANGIVVHNCGKTFMVLVSTEQQIKHGVLPRGKTLVCVKLPTLETGWLDDCAQFTDLKIVSLWTPQMSTQKGLSGKDRRRAEIIARLESPADLFVINHEGLLNYEDLLVAKDFRKVVVDESTIMKGFHGASLKFKGGQFTRSLLAVSHKADWRVIMTGTPAPNGADNLWGQFKFLDPDGFLLEPNFHDFRRRFMKEIVYGRKDEAGKKLRRDMPSKWVVRPECVGEIYQMIAPLTYRLLLRDHLKDLPELTVMKRYVAMDPAQARHYREMKKAMATMIHDKFVAVDLKLTQLLKLRQITGGFLRDDQEVDHALPANPKIAALDDLLNDEIAPELKVVVYAQYRWEVALIEARYKRYGAVSVYGANSATRNLAAIRSFREDPAVRVIVLHPKSAAHGVTFTVAHHLVFYSISHSEEENYQCIKRIERNGQKNAMFVYYLLCRDTIDSNIYDVLQLKKRNQEQLIDQRDIDRELLKAMEQGL